MVRMIAAVLGAAVLVSARSTMAGMCMPREDMVRQLVDRYGEAPRGMGVTERGGAMIELFVSDAGTFTVLVTRTDGIACIAASGSDWQAGHAVAGEGT